MKAMGINKKFVELTQTDIENIILELKKRIKTVSINTEIRGLKTFFNYLYKDNLIKDNPMENIKQMRDRRRIIETLETEEIEKMATHIKKQNSFVGIRDLTIFIVMLDTGIRLSELVGVEVDDICGSRMIIRRTKNLTQRMAYLSKRTQEQLTVYLRLRGNLDTKCLFVNVDNSPLRQRGLQSRFYKYRTECKIRKQFSPHILRHTFAKRAVMNGIDAFSLAALLGHSDISVSKRYVNLWGSDIEKKHAKYGPLKGLKI